MKEALIGVDIGTGAARAAAFDLDGRMLAHVEQAYGVQSPRPGWVEQSPGDVWQAVCAVLRRTAGSLAGAARPLALALACQSGSVMALDAAFQPVSPNITWMDGRGAGVVDEWRTSGADRRVRAITGWMPHAGLALASLAWLRQHRPDGLAQASRIASMNDYLVWRLTGAWLTNPSNASPMQLLDLERADWSDEVCSLAGIRPGDLPPVWPSGAAVGPLLPDVCRATGLPAGIRVVNGGHDQACTALALGVSAAGQALLAGGTSWVLTDVASSLDIGQLPEAMDAGFHVLPGERTASQSLGGLGRALAWWLDCAEPAAPGRGLHARYEALNAAVAQSPPGSHGLVFLPVSGGHAAPAGQQRGGFALARLDHTPGDLARAVMESAAFELRWALEAARAGGLAVEQMWMAGGATGSPHWPRIVADAGDIPLMVTRQAHWPALGAAILAGYGARAYPDISAGQARVKPDADCIRPDRALRGAYDEAYGRYRRTSALAGGV